MKILIHSCADITEVFLNAVTKVSQTRDINVVGIYSRTLEKATKYQQKHQLDFASDDYEQVLQSDKFDTVYIASPNSLHYSIALKAIKSNKNVIIEKPLALKVDEIIDLYEQAKIYNVYVFDAVLTTYTNTLQKIKKIVEVDQVQLIDFHLAKQTRHFDEYKNGKYLNVFDKKMGGGSFNDLGVYLVYPLLYLFGYEYQVNSDLELNDLGADEAVVVCGRIAKSLFTLRTSKLVLDNRSSVICTTKHTISIGNINLMDNITIYDSKGNELSKFNSTDVKMEEEVLYFSKVSDGECSFDTNLITLAIEARKFMMKVGI